jgi:hypothetical protein
MIFETDTNRVLVWDNAAWVMIADTDSPPGLQLVKAQTVGTGVSSVTVTGAFSAEFDNYKIMWSGGAGSAGFNVRLQMGSATSGHTNSLIYNVFGSASTVIGAALQNAAYWEWAGAGNSTSLFCNLDLLSPFLTENTRMIAHWTPPDGAGWSNGVLLDTSSYTSFTLTPGISGTFTGGTIRVYGYRN